MTSPPPPPPEDSPGRRDRAWPWLVVLAAAGAVLAVLPHLIRWARSGDPSYIADGDALLYLAWSRAIVRHGGTALTDAVLRSSGPMMHPWLLFVPPAWIAHRLGAGMTGLGVVWRLLAGPAVALGLYAAVRPFTRSARGAAGLAAFLLFDAGLLVGQVVQRQGEVLVAIARGSGNFFADVPKLLPHLRVPTPALALPFFLAHLALAHRARRLGTTRSALAAGGSLGLLFHVYFYFATAAALGTILAWLLDRGGRRTYGLMLVAGALIAAPAVVEGARIKASTPPDWLVRTDKFVPIGRFDGLILPKVLLLEWLVAAPFVFRPRRDLLYLWSCTGAGLLLVNQQVATGMNLENFHWMYAYGTAFSLLLSLLVLPGAARLRGWRWIAPAVVAAQVAIGSGLRAVEATRSAEANAYMAMLDAWRAEGFAIPPGSVVAGPTPLLLLLGAVEDVDVLGGRLVDFSSRTTDPERDVRDSLDLALIGASPEEAAAEIRGTQHITEDQRAFRRRMVAEYAAGPVAEVDRFRVTAIVTESGHRPPTALGDRARLVAKGRAWDLWRVGPPR